MVRGNIKRWGETGRSTVIPRESSSQSTLASSVSVKDSGRAEWRGRGCQPWREELPMKGPCQKRRAGQAASKSVRDRSLQAACDEMVGKQEKNLSGGKIFGDKSYCGMSEASPPLGANEVTLMLMLRLLSPSGPTCSCRCSASVHRAPGTKCHLCSGTQWLWFFLQSVCHCHSLCLPSLSLFSQGPPWPGLLLRVSGPSLCWER